MTFSYEHAGLLAILMNAILPPQEDPGEAPPLCRQQHNRRKWFPQPSPVLAKQPEDSELLDYLTNQADLPALYSYRAFRRRKVFRTQAQAQLDLPLPQTYISCRPKAGFILKTLAQAGTQLSAACPSLVSRGMDYALSWADVHCLR